MGAFLLKRLNSTRLIMASRKRRRSHYHRGTYVSLKTGQVCKHRSGWEASYMAYLDADPTVLTWSYEQVVIPYVSNKKTGKIRKYYPDFLVTRTSGARELVEIKPSKRVAQPRVVKKLAAAGVWCAASQVALVVLTELGLRQLGLLK